MNTEILAGEMKTSEKHDRPKTIMVVDDNATVANMIATGLRRLGRIHVEIACGGKEALEMVGRTRPDLVIVNIGMPKMDGIETARRLRLLHPCTIIFSTGLWDSKTLQRSREILASHHLVKPFNPGQLPAANPLTG